MFHLHSAGVIASMPLSPALISRPKTAAPPMVLPAPRRDRGMSIRGRAAPLTTPTTLPLSVTIPTAMVDVGIRISTASILMWLSGGRPCSDVRSIVVLVVPQAARKADAAMRRILRLFTVASFEAGHRESPLHPNAVNFSHHPPRDFPAPD